MRQESVIYLILAATVLIMPAFGETNYIGALIQSLNDDNSSVRDAAVSSLIKIGDPAVVPLIQALKNDTQPHVRANAAMALGNIKDKRATDPLIQALSDKDVDVRRGSAVALVQFASHGISIDLAIDPLIKALNDTDWSIRANVATALGNAKNKSATIPLIQALGDGNQSVRRYAAYALGSIGDGRAAAPLAQALKDKDSSVKAAAATALGEIQAPPESHSVQGNNDKGKDKASQDAAYSQAIGSLCSGTSGLINGNPSGLSAPL